MSDLPEVCIDTPPLTITVKGQGDVDNLAATALALYRTVLPSTTGRPEGGVGFVTERNLENPNER